MAYGNGLTKKLVQVFVFLEDVYFKANLMAYRNGSFRNKALGDMTTAIIEWLRATKKLLLTKITARGAEAPHLRMQPRASGKAT